ncbi:MAG: RagB/SusD family nutrient uptake outer membrane protein [Bacteroidales bacterium]|nr:RagB/SusD family nutrient uptake outer membrane protein [Bacteroidales bacterium]MBQ9583200.1 RagB/SusD family nutrient uptake outer membrane protein [Bacteroidales bacterium]
MKTRFIIILFAAFAAVSCSGFLDIRTEATMPSAGLDYSKTENVFMPVSAAYASMRLGEGEAQNYVGVMEIVSDDADKGSSESDGPTVAQLDNFSYGPDNNNVEAMWNYYFNISSAANFAIESMDLFAEAITSEAGQQTVVECRGEAKIIRAYAYFNLVRLFGTVPIIDRTMTSAELASAQAASAEDIYTFIYRDLDDAIAIVPDSHTDYKGRYNKYTAMALKAKVALYRKDWNEAARLSDLIIASGRYSLMSRFKDAFNVENEGGAESIMEIESSDLGQTTGGMPLSYYGFIQAPRGGKEPLQGWGYKVPSQRLIDFLDSRGDNVRKQVTLLEVGRTTPEGDLITSSMKEVFIDGEKTLVPINPYYNGKVYVPSRYNNRSFNACSLDHNMRIIRYADLLLIFAEAMASGATITPTSGYSAETALNEVRHRAGLDTAPATLENIYDERRAELALEENRFFDLVRWGKAAEVLGPLGFTTGKNEVFPIPAAQRQLNPNLPATPGYVY